MISPDQLIKWAPASKNFAADASLFFNKYADQYDVNAYLRIAAFLSQVIHESGSFRYTSELWGPTAQQLKYERDFSQPYPELNKNGRNYLATQLGNELKGDGEKFKGHGYIQDTGRVNHAACSKDLFGDENILLDNPEKLSEPEFAMQSAFWFWAKKGLNTFADVQAFSIITKRINGGLNGFTDRVHFYNLIRADFGLQPYEINQPG